MARQLFLGALGIFAWVGAGDALATTYQLTCGNTSSDHLQASLTGTAAWSSPATMAAVVPGDVVELANSCQGDIVLANNSVPITGVTITNSANSSTLNGTDGINGQIEIRNGQLTLQGLLLQSGTNGDVMTNGEFANVYVHDGGSVMLSGDTIGPGPLIGLYVLRASSAQLLSATVTGVGTANIAKENDGIRIEASSTAVLARTSGNATTVFNGLGNGITLIAGSSMEFFDGTVHDNAGAQIYVSRGSSAGISGVGAETSSTARPQPPLIEVVGASTATIDTSSFIQNTGSGAASGGLLAASASSVVLNSAEFATSGSSQPVIEASAGSSLVLAGNNNICAGVLSGDPLTCAPTGGTAIQIDHSSNLIHEQATTAGYPSVGIETITGAGLVQEQSSMDLGQGLVSSAPSLAWTLSGSEIINVQQNSSFRLSGGVTISGGNVKIQQGSNGFFNLNNGGTNAATIVCTNSANNPSVHLSNPGSVSSATTFNLNDLLAGDSQATHAGQTNACLNF